MVVGRCRRKSSRLSIDLIENVENPHYYQLESCHYQFKDGEFISKDEIKDSLYLEKSSNTIIKEVTSGDSCVIEEEIIKNDEQGE